MPVTSIQDMVNASKRTVMFINTEFSGNNAELLDGQDIDLRNCWIPWCTKQQDFAGHHIQIQDDAGRVLWFIWQNGDDVRASQTGFASDASPINGISKAGSSLTLVMTTKGIRTYPDGQAPTSIDSDLPP